MANHKSALKRIRTSDKKRLRNRYYSKTMRNAIRKFRAISVKEEAASQLSGLVSLIDKLAKRLVIHKNKASNLKSKLMRKVNNL